jgi:hypothetical protein
MKAIPANIKSFDFSLCYFLFILVLQMYDILFFIVVVLF